jgi:hypothetical protein
LEGRSLELIGWMRRRRRLELILVLADGSRLLVPAAWTDLERPVEPLEAGTVGSVWDLLAMRRVLDGVLRAGLLEDRAGGRGVVLAGRDDFAGEKDGAVASSSGGVTGARGGAVGAGGLREAPDGDRAAGGVDRADGRRRGGGR